MTSSNTYDLNITSNSELKRMELTVFIVDKALLEEDYTNYIDAGTYIINQGSSTPTSTFTPPSFNYFNYILGMTSFRVDSTVNPNFYQTPANAFESQT